jgi:hypothetical protein
MTQAEKQLWSRILAFQLDDNNAALPFSVRLARESGWERKYTLRVIEEYKKFVFLCCVSPVPVTPSDPVDQAWHLHLTYTKSYWIELCRNTIGKDLHHNPTKGGPAETAKFTTCYTHLNSIYRDKFRQEPPQDIWHSDEIRFSQQYFKRINPKEHWIIKKRVFNRRAITGLAAAIAGGLLFIQASDGPVALIVIAVLIIAGIVAAKNGNGKNGPGNGNTPSSCSGDFHTGCSSHGDCGDSGCCGCGGD